MFNFRIKSFAVMMLTCALGLALTAAQADAGFQVTFRVGGSAVTITDDTDGIDDAGSGVDREGDANSIDVTGVVVGGYTFNVTLATSNTPGGMLLAFVNTGTNEIIGSGAAMIEIVASANGFTAPTGHLTAISGSTGQFLSGTVAGNEVDFSYAAYYDTTNALATNDAGTLIGSAAAGTVSAPTGNVNLSDTEVFTNNTTPFTLTLVLKADLLDAGANRIDLDGTLELNPVPGPAGIVLALIAAPVLGVGGMIRRKRKQVVA